MSAETTDRMKVLRLPPKSNCGVQAILQLLTDTNEAVQYCAINGLLSIVDYSWHEIADATSTIEALAADSKSKLQKPASLLMAKLLYNLDLTDEAVVFAMAAGELLDLSEDSEFTRAVVSRAVHHYCGFRERLFETALDEEQSSEKACGPALQTAGGAMDERLESLVDRLLHDSRIDEEQNQGHEALGVALESRRLDYVKKIIESSPVPFGLLKYCVEVSRTSIESTRFADLLLKTIIGLYESEFQFKGNSNILSMEYATIVRALFLLGDVDRLARLLGVLLQLPDSKDAPNMYGLPNAEDGISLAYQAAFDLVSYEDQSFLVRLMNSPHLRLPVESDNSQPSTDSAGSTTQQEQNSQPTATDDNGPGSQPNDIEDTESSNDSGTDTIARGSPDAPTSETAIHNAEGSAREESQRGGDQSSEGLEARSQPVVAASNGDSIDEDLSKKTHSSYRSQAYRALFRLHQILSGAATLTLHIDFLHRSNRTDLAILDQIKSTVDQRSSVIQNALVLCHALMQAGTTSDVYLRENLEWFGRAQGWAKFTASASTGVLHKGHVTVSRQVLASYLPGSGGGPYSEGGSLYALGLIHGNKFDNRTRMFLLDELGRAQQRCPANYEPLQHGACLGLGLLTMGTGDSDVYSALREVLFTDAAVAGEAAALAMGLTFFGTGNSRAIAELLGYAHDTEHERIVRGASLGVALVLFQRKDIADTTIQEMIKDKDAIIRYSGMFAVGLAYCGSANRTAVRRLLHAAVTDASSDVRRGAVMALGFVLCNKPDEVPRIASLLADSFNPYVRYGATLAVGIGCAATGSQAAVELLYPLTQDTTDFVRQGALLGLGLVLVECSPGALPGNAVQKARDIILRVACDKHEDSITRFGAIVAQGLIDVGGRNCTISLLSPNGSVRPEAAVGLSLFAQLWYWFPLVLGVSLAFRPTALIGVNEELCVAVDFLIESNTPPAKFAYVENVKKFKREEKKNVITAVLSTAHKRQQQARMKKLHASVSNVNGTAMTMNSVREKIIAEAASSSSNTEDVVMTGPETGTLTHGETDASNQMTAVPDNGSSGASGHEADIPKTVTITSATETAFVAAQNVPQDTEDVGKPQVGESLPVVSSEAHRPNSQSTPQQQQQSSDGSRMVDKSEKPFDILEPTAQQGELAAVQDSAAATTGVPKTAIEWIGSNSTRLKTESANDGRGSNGTRVGSLVTAGVQPTILRSPCRVLPCQQNDLRLVGVPGSYWEPVDKSRRFGIVLVRPHQNEAAEP